MLIDGCLFAGEQKMLELRLRTLASVVDHFCVVACSRTHQGEPADTGQITLAFVRAREAADVEASLSWVHPELGDWPAGTRGGVNTPQYQRLERQHRDGMRWATESFFADRRDYEAVVMMSDVDEIPHPDAVRRLPELLSPAGQLPVGLVMLQRFHSTALDLLHPQEPWLGTCVQRAGDVEPQAMRDSRGMLFEQGAVVPHGGWHLSWLGTDAERRRKLDTFSHAEIAARGDDPAVWRANGTHANGEVLRRLSAAEVRALDWPAPLVDRSFTAPDEWGWPL